MLQRTALSFAAFALLVLSGCGGASGKTFDLPGIRITFKYPASFKPLRTFHYQRSIGGRAAAQGAVSLDPRNIIGVSSYDLNVTITHDNLARYKAEVDRVVSQLATTRVSGREVEYGGLPGYEYVIDLTSPPDGQSRIAVLFDQATEYLINCQSTPEKRDAIESGCRKAFDSLQTK